MRRPTRRDWLNATAASVGLVLCAPVLAAQPTANFVEVWKSPSCGCCKAWIEILEKQGFTVQVHDVGNNAIRGKLGIPMNRGSCHTARIGRYALEGHVPVADIRRLLKEQPDAIGLAVPGMPVGSPGMDGPEYEGRRDPYDVLLVLKDGTTRVFSHQNER